MLGLSICRTRELGNRSNIIRLRGICYGITAPELNCDEYKGVDVKGKIVMVEREVPVSASKEPELKFVFSFVFLRVSSRLISYGEVLSLF
ncbi:MAG: hypothetical protein GY950_16775, partial [bacterium]|nr:hypothetical protein [bacterium]